METGSDFRLIEKLHEDRQTHVYRAQRNSDNSPVVLKILSGEQSQVEAAARYQHEFEIARSLSDVEGVVKAQELLVVQDSLMIVEEDVAAESLDRIWARGKPGLLQTLELAVSIARILGGIHQHNVIHKDINPSNIIWNRETGVVQIIDFGISSLLNHERQDFMSPARLEGTLTYISPEQTGRVNRDLDYRSDLYSFGITLYELLVGAPPFQARQGIELVHAHIALPLPPPHHVDPAIPHVLSQIVLRLTEKMADDRYQSVWGAMHDLERCLTDLRQSGRMANFPLGSGDVPMRFRIPQKLYGRERELAAIHAAFDRAAAGDKQFLLVKGAPGVGKSALVHEVYRPLTEKHGNFVAGKFDQYQRDVPFSAWTRAFQELCNLLLQEDEVVLERWRSRILIAVGDLGRVLIDVVPSIELIIGKQPEVPVLPPDQALNRLNYVLGNFIEAVGSAEHPLVLFIDDWQWADAGSLSLLRFVLTSGAHDHVLVIGAYRDNEVDGTHPFSLVLEAIGKDGVVFETLSLANLAAGDVGNLVGDTLGRVSGMEMLTGLLFEKTQGNAFFLIQLLNDLHDKGVISFERSQRCWVWDMERVELASVPENVVELMAQRIRGLPEAAQHALTHAACIGDRFPLGMLAKLLGRPAYGAAEDLAPALQEGIIVPVGLNYRFAGQSANLLPVYYQFVHDRVRQAAYGMIDGEVATAIHYRIARGWLDDWSDDRKEQRVARGWLDDRDDEWKERRVFEIANQYNAARQLVSTPGQRDELRNINFQAGKRAKQAADYPTSLNYFRIALDLRPDDIWETEFEKCAETLLLAAEVGLLSKEYGYMEAWLDEFLLHVSAPLEQVRAHRIRLQAHVARNRLVEAVDVGLQALRLLGLDLPKTPSKLLVLFRLMQTRLAIKRRSFTDLYSLPEMTDAVRLAAMDILGLILPPAYWTYPDLLALIVFQMVRETLENGHSPNAGYGLAWWGITESALLGNIDAGDVFGEFAVELARKYRLNLQQPLFFSGWVIHKYKHPLRESLPLLEQSYAVALEKGDFEYASYARNNQIQMLFHTGTPLPELLSEAERAHRDLMRFQVGSSLYWHDIWWQAAMNFASGAAPVDVLAGPAYQEEVSLPQHLKVSDHSTLFLLYVAKMMLAFVYRDVRAAAGHADQARLRLPGGTGMHAHALFHFYDSMVQLAVAESAGGELSAACRKRVAANQKVLKRLASHAPMNYAHHWHLVEAGTLAGKGQTDEALRHYERAIDCAGESGHGHEEALAYELMGRFLFAQKREHLAAYHLRQALQLYERWGAEGKAENMRSDFSMLLLAVSQTTGKRQNTQGGFTSTQNTESFDMDAVIQASQAISSEIIADRLIETLLRIVIEHSGAQRAALILKRENALQVEAVGNSGESITVRVEALPLGEQTDLILPRTIIQYVGRTLKTVAIDDARHQSPFSRDPYFLRELPLSVLCEPIVLHGKLVGVLYLENHLIAGAFTKGRLELLRMLSAQAAISIENANLYAMLEQKVRERTQKLQDSLGEQERLNTELQTSGSKLEAAYAQLSDANRRLEERANTDGLTGLANRRYFDERLDYELARSAREQQSLALIMCDIDNFKPYNDLYGHVAGDECLRRTAEAIRSVFARTVDLVARYGGEEFVVLLPATELDEAMQMAEKMLLAVSSLAIEHAGNGRYGQVTVSIGAYSLVPTPFTSYGAVVDAADRALYQAKDQGRNCIVLAT